MTAKSARKQAYGYVRVSGRAQTGAERDGFPRQEAEIRRYVARQGWELVNIFREEGVSGRTDLENRPALVDLLEAIESEGVRIVLIERLDRLARDLMVQETIIADLRKRGVQLVSVTEPDLLEGDPSRVLMRQIFGAIAQYDRAMLVAKLRGARERKRRTTGRCEGVKPYGYYDGEQKVVRLIRKLRQEGLTIAAIAEQLNVDGVTARSGGQWHPTQVQRVLRPVR